jgi:hypothetical protein
VEIVGTARLKRYTWLAQSERLEAVASSQLRRLAAPAATGLTMPQCVAWTKAWKAARNNALVERQGGSSGCAAGADPAPRFRPLPLSTLMPACEKASRRPFFMNMAPGAKRGRLAITAAACAAAASAAEGLGAACGAGEGGAVVSVCIGRTHLLQLHTMMHRHMLERWNAALVHSKQGASSDSGKLCKYRYSHLASAPSRRWRCSCQTGACRRGPACGGAPPRRLDSTCLRQHAPPCLRHPLRLSHSPELQLARCQA